MWACRVRDTGALLSPNHGTGEYHPRGEHDCWRGVLLREMLFSETIVISSCLISYLSRMASEDHKRTWSVCFQTCFSSPMKERVVCCRASVFLLCFFFVLFLLFLLCLVWFKKQPPTSIDFFQVRWHLAVRRGAVQTIPVLEWTSVWLSCLKTPAFLLSLEPHVPRCCLACGVEQLCFFHPSPYSKH